METKNQKEFGYQIDSQSNFGTGGDEDEEATQDESKKDFDYILSMPNWNLTMEKKDEILKQQKQKGDELKQLRGKSKETLWLEDIAEFLAALEKLEAKEKEEVSQTKSFKAGKAQSAAAGSSKSSKNQKTSKNM